MFERIAIDSFYREAVRSHYLLRLVSFVVVSVLLCRADLISPAMAGLWFAALGAAEVGVRVWYPRLPAVFRTRQEGRRAMSQFAAFAALLAALYAGPILLLYDNGVVGASVGLAISSSILVVICVQHDLARSMFYSSGAVPALAMVLCMSELSPPSLQWYMVAAAITLLANARNLHHSNAATFKGLVEAELEADTTNARLQSALVEAQAGSKAKSVFLATMSHELRTPLNGVLGMANVLAWGKLGAAEREQVEVIRRSGETLLTILNDVLDLAKIEAGRLELEEIEFDIATALADIVALFGSIATDRNLTFEADVASLSGLVVGDPTRFRQVLSNLLSNAVKFTEHGGVRLFGERLSSTQVRFQIRDTGIGMSEPDIAGLFQRFQQADGSVTRRFGGTGLGLAICKDLVSEMNGVIKVESASGQGSLFTVTLDLPAAGARSPSTASASEPPVPTHEPRRAA